MSAPSRPVAEAAAPDLDPAASAEGDATLDRALRPARLEDYTGQAGTIATLRAMLAGAAGRGEPVEHLCFYGPPGLGKTTLASIIAAESGTGFRVTSGPALERIGDLVAILVSLRRGDVLLIDEIHRLPSKVQETLYGAMEDFRVEVVRETAAGPSALSLSIAPFTLVGATTDVDRVAGPLRDRFGALFRLEWYSDPEMRLILARSAALLGLALEPGTLEALVGRARGVPRIANRLLRRVRDELALAGGERVSSELVAATMARLGVDAAGLDPADRRFLLALRDHYDGGPVGLAPVGAITGDPVSTIEGVIEPYLVRIGFVRRTPRGRELTARGREHLAEAGV